MNFTLVAYYGKKPKELSDLIKNTQQRLKKEFKANFAEYKMDQVHATLIGLEGHRNCNHIINTNYLELKKQLKIIDFEKLFATIDHQFRDPIHISFCGYKKDRKYPFTSRGLHPYLRSFSIQANTAVAMGWPKNKALYPFSIDTIRRSFNEANIVHKYHVSSDAIDNDFFFVLGTIKKDNLKESEIDRLQNNLRMHLSDLEPVSISLSKENLSIVGYTDTKLPPDSSIVYSLEEAKRKINDIINNYSEISL